MSTENVMETAEMTTIEEVVEETINEANSEIENSEIENSTTEEEQDEIEGEEGIDYFICRECGCIIEAGDEIEVRDSYGNEYYLCSDCLDAKLERHEIFRCEYCDEFFDWGAGQHDDNDYHVCDSCYNSYYTRCEDCGLIVYSDETHTARISWNRHITICEDCAMNGDYTTCSCCDSLVHTNYSVSDDYTTICESCYNDYYYHCQECDRLIHSDDTYWDEEDDTYCEECYNNYGSRNTNAIHEYSYKPHPEFYECVDENTNLFMGVELEVDRGRHNGEVAEEIIETMKNKIYCKRDGSLDEGFEIVSHPCTLKYHTEKMEWNSIMKHLIDNGFRSHDTSTCGVHVHVSRGFFGDTNDEQDLHIAKLIMLIDKFWEKVVTFSRRRSDNLNRWASKNNIEVTDEDMTEVIIDKIKKQKNSGRYKAINLTNLHTIEFRIFRGTLKHETFLATLQFVETLCHYAKQISLPEIWRVNFTDIFQNTEYTELRNYLESKGLIASSVSLSDTLDTDLEAM